MSYRRDLLVSGFSRRIEYLLMMQIPNDVLVIINGYSTFYEWNKDYSNKSVFIDKGIMKFKDVSKLRFSGTKSFWLFEQNLVSFGDIFNWKISITNYRIAGSIDICIGLIENDHHLLKRYQFSNGDWSWISKQKGFVNRFVLSKMKKEIEMTIDLRDKMEKIITYRENDSFTNELIINNKALSNHKQYRFAVCVRFESAYYHSICIPPRNDSLISIDFM